MNPTSTPSAIVLEQLQLLHQIQTHTFPPTHVFFFAWILGLPLLPLQTKLHMYNVLLPIVSHLSPLFAVLLLIFWEAWIILMLVLLYFLLRFLLNLFHFSASSILLLASTKKVKKVFMQLIFPSDTSKSAYATQQLYMLLHGLARQKTFIESVARLKKAFSLEIVATKKEGIRFLLVVDEKAVEVIKRSIRSYLPGIQIKEVDDYLSKKPDIHQTESITELKLSNHFALPLHQQNVLSQHDFIGYLAGSMTQLVSDEQLIAFQMVTTPVINSTHGSIQNELKKLRYAMYKQEALVSKLNKSPIDEFLSLPGICLIWWGVKAFFVVCKYAFLFVVSILPAIMDSSGKSIPILMTPEIKIPAETLNPYEQELKTIVKEKIDQQLFETSIRILIKAGNKNEIERRLSGLLASFGPMSSSYQSVTTKSSFFGLSSFKRRFNEFSNRLLSIDTRFNKNSILSSAEIADFYHFPYSDTTRTEDMVKNLSQELSAPLSLKQGGIWM